MMGFLFFLFLGLVEGQVRTTDSPKIRPTWSPADVIQLPCLSYKNLLFCKTHAYSGLRAANFGICKSRTDYRCAAPAILNRTQYKSIMCPSCVPTGILTDFCKERVTTKCTSAADLKAVFKLTKDKMTICPSCIAASDSTCSAEQLRTCATKMAKSGTRATACKEGEKPQLTSNCCLSCTPQSIVCRPNDQRTRSEKISKYQATPACKDGEVPVVKSDCSRSCKLKPVRTRANAEQKCTRQDLVKGVLNAPVCETDEKPIKDKSILRCGPSCRRTESGFDLKEVVDCIKDLKRCPTGERPLYIPGSKCRTCVMAKPSCPSACSNKQVCVRRSKDFSEYESKPLKCLLKRAFKMVIKTKEAFKKFRNMTKEQAARVILEVVERYCERNSEATRCEKLLDRIKDSLACKKRTTAPNGDVTVEVEVAGTDEEDSKDVRGGKERGGKEGKTDRSGRRLLAESTLDGTEELIQDSINDDTDDFTSANILGNDDNGSLTTLPGLAILVSIIAFLGTN